MVATLDFATYDKQVMVSNLTLSFFHDSGWYVPNYDQAGYLEWGKGAGCTSLGTCADYSAAVNPNRYYCTPDSTAYTCAADDYSMGKCQANSGFGDNCGMVHEGPTCTDETTFAFDASLKEEYKTVFGFHHSPASRCIKTAGDLTATPDVATAK